MKKISDIFGVDPLLAPLIRKLSHYTTVSAQDVRQLKKARSKPKTYTRHEVFLERDQYTNKVFLIAEGLVAQEMLNEEGNACIVGFLIPGDLSDINSSLADSSDVALKCLTTVSLVEFSSDRLREILEASANLKQAFTILQFVSESMVRELILTIATRQADKKIAHLLCELTLRLKKVFPEPRIAMCVPLTQSEIGEALRL